MCGCPFPLSPHRCFCFPSADCELRRGASRADDVGVCVASSDHRHGDVHGEQRARDSQRARALRVHRPAPRDAAGAGARKGLQMTPVHLCSGVLQRVCLYLFLYHLNLSSQDISIPSECSVMLADGCARRHTGERAGGAHPESHEPDGGLRGRAAAAAAAGRSGRALLAARHGLHQHQVCHGVCVCVCVCVYASVCVCLYLCVCLSVPLVVVEVIDET